MPNTKPYIKLLHHFRGYLIGRNYITTQKALDLMMHAFGDALRKDGETPIWSHSLYVAAFLRTLPIPEDLMEDVLTAALLHDVLEDVPEYAGQLEDIVSPEILHTLTRLDKTRKSTEYYYNSGLDDIIFCFVKPSDRIHNLHTMLGGFTKEKISRYIVETEDYVLPLLKKAKRHYPEYEACFENMKLIIGTQLAYASGTVEFLPDDYNKK